MTCSLTTTVHQGTEGPADEYMYKVDFTSQNEEEEERQYQAIVGKRPSPISSELELELRKYEDAHKMASESNLTLHNAIKVG